MKAIVNLIIEYGVNVVGAILLLVVAWIFAGFFGQLLARNLQKGGFDETLT